ncbi:carboxymuconolactone decarboxylase family protein [Halobacillus mangrovi]|uniref:carboxymuconolactone decarboxylase family protein n=1 Tax=Halobacillus mangrovi TaxID=402384 RepID=UPI003D96119C
MPWIKPVKQKEMKELDINNKKDGPLSIFDRMLANAPDLYEAFIPLQKAIVKTSISDDLREAIITFVSMKNGCEFCTTSHKEVLAGYTDQLDVLDWLENYSENDMSKEWKAALQYSERLIAKPVEVTRDDIKSLDVCGYSSRQIAELNQIVAYTSYTNQLSIGLGL